MARCGLGKNLADDLKTCAKMFRDNQDLKEFLQACEEEKREAMYYMLKRHLKFKNVQPFWYLMGIKPSESIQSEMPV